MRAKEFTTCTESKKINKDITKLSWTSLDEGLSLSDKISIFEQYHIYGNLTESIDDDKKTYFLSLSKMSDMPQHGKKFIVVPLSLIGNRILPLDDPRYLEYVGKDNGQLVFKYKDREIRYPSKTMRDLSLSNTFTFLNQDAYNKFKTALSLKFDVILPKIDVAEERLVELGKFKLDYKRLNGHPDRIVFGADDIPVKVEFLIENFGKQIDIIFSVNNRLSMTGAGNQFRIFSHVLNVIREQIKDVVRKNTTRITFSSEAKEESRTSLYARSAPLITKIFKKQLGDEWEFAGMKSDGNRYYDFVWERKNTEER